jgi:hypothetical protein
VSIVFEGIKKGPLRAWCFAHGWLSPDGYTILPMRRPTTRITTILIMGGIDKQKFRLRQRLSRKQPSRVQINKNTLKPKKQLVKSLPVTWRIRGQRFPIAEQ